MKELQEKEEELKRLKLELELAQTRAKLEQEKRKVRVGNDALTHQVAFFWEGLFLYTEAFVLCSCRGYNMVYQW